MAVDRTFHWDRSLPGFGLQRTQTGHESFVFQYRVPGSGVSRRMKLDGGWLRYEADREKRTVESFKGTARAAAKREAEAVRGAIAQGRDPLAEMRRATSESQNTFKAVAERYMGSDGSRLRSRGDRQRILEALVYPRLGSRPINGIGRRDIVAMLDATEQENGPVQADHVLAVVRKIMNWHAARTDDFNSPIVKGMARTKPKERRRQRILTDEELRTVWKTAAAEKHPFSWLVRFLLLTATRRNEAARMSRNEVSGNDWIIPGPRHKSKRDFLLPLSGEATRLLKEIPAIGRKGLVFTNDGKTPISGFSKYKAAFDEASGTSGWTLHDLRRTARSLMSRSGCDPDHSELAMGHVLPTIRGTYDVHSYAKEKRAVAEALAAQIDRIVHPKKNVVAIRSRK